VLNHHPMKWILKSEAITNMLSTYKVKFMLPIQRLTPGYELEHHNTEAINVAFNRVYSRHGVLRSAVPKRAESLRRNLTFVQNILCHMMSL
jgi:hypothetical protein